MKKFAVFDIDGTLIRWQLYHAIADTLVNLGYGDAKNFQAVKDSRMLWKRRKQSFKQYETDLVKVVDKMLLGLSVDQYSQAIEHVFEEYKDQVYTFTRDLLKELKAKKYLLFAISGSQEEVVSKIASYYGFNEFIGSSYIRKGQRFTGEKIVRTSNKDKLLKELVDKHNADWQESIAVGDSLGDLSMLETVERPIAFNPEESLYEHAKAKGWEIVIERKNVVYKLLAGKDSYRLS